MDSLKKTTLRKEATIARFRDIGPRNELVPMGGPDIHTPVYC